MTSHQVTNMARISYRQLDFWARAGHIPGVERLCQLGSGVPREWSDREAHFVCVLARLVRAGVLAGKASKALREQMSPTGQLPSVLTLDGGLRITTTQVAQLAEAVSS